MQVPAENVKRALLESFPELDKDKVECFFKDNFLVHTDKDKLKEHIKELEIEANIYSGIISSLKLHTLPFYEKEINSGNVNFTPLTFYRINGAAIDIPIECKYMSNDMKAQLRDFKMFLLKYNRKVFQASLKDSKEKLRNVNNEINRLKKELNED